MAEEDIYTSFNQDKLIECLTKQLSELELFQTMYTPREIVITNNEVVDCIRNFIVKKTDYSPNHLDYTINNFVENLKLEISIHLLSLYPEVAPEIYVRCNQLNRQQEKSLNTELTAYIQSKSDGEVCIFTAISWLQDNVENFAIKEPTLTSRSPKYSQTKLTYCRYWVYSHHIYSKKKMEDIVKLSRELHLTGFCLIGKPGVICVEGVEEDCKVWWRDIKTMNWQKITLRITEDFNQNEMPVQQKFKSFDVIQFPSPISSHSDMGKFQKYIENVGLLEQVNKFFDAS